MHPEIQVWLKDIELSIKEIHDFLPSPKNYLLFQNDLKTRKAVERTARRMPLTPFIFLLLSFIFYLPRTARRTPHTAFRST